MNSFEKFKEDLPNNDQFYKSLTTHEISDAVYDYEHAVKGNVNKVCGLQMGPIF